MALVVGTTAGGTGVHVRMLAAGLAGRGIRVSVVGPSSADAAFGFGALDGVTFSPVQFGDRPRLSDMAALLRLRRLLNAQAGQTRRPGHTERPGQTEGSGYTVRPGVVHAHGLRAGALTVLALVGLPGHGRRVHGRRGQGGYGLRGRQRQRGQRRRGQQPGLVVTVHNAPPSGRGTAALIYRSLELIVARRADLVLCVSADLEARMRSAGARHIGRAIVPSPSAATGPLSDPPPIPSSTPIPTTAHGDIAPSTPLAPPTPPAPSTPSTPSTLPAPPDVSKDLAPVRPLVLAAGRLVAQKGFDVLLDAATHWPNLDPAPLVAIAGDGPLAGELRARASSLGVDAVFLGRRADIADLLAAAAVFVLPSRWEGQPLIVQEALRAGAAIVATRVGGVPDLVGDDAALLVEPGDAAALAVAVSAVLTDVSLATRLRAAASGRGAALPTETDAIAAALAAYAQVRSLT